MLYSITLLVFATQIYILQLIYRKNLNVCLVYIPVTFTINTLHNIWYHTLCLGSGHVTAIQPFLTLLEAVLEVFTCEAV